MKLDEVDTPALLLDFDKLERNLDAMARRFEGARVKLRPHAKTHKTALVARMQLERGAIGVCCAKLGEAEVLAANGIDEILITTEIVGALKVARLIELATLIAPIVVVDDAAAARDISAAAAARGKQLDVLVDIDIGQHRTGCAPGEPALALGHAVDAMPGLRLRGLQGYEGHLQHLASAAERRAAHGAAMALLEATAAAFATAGLSTEIVTTGGTGTADFAAEASAVTDVQPGSYAVMDAQYGDVEGVRFEHALTVLTTVISVNADRAVVDAGFKALGSDAGTPRAPAGSGAFAFAGDEHGTLRTAAAPRVRLGQKLQLVPGHCDTTINLYDEYVVHRAGNVIARWPIIARGQTR